MAVGQELVVHPFSPVVDGHSRVLIFRKSAVGEVEGESFLLRASAEPVLEGFSGGVSGGGSGVGGGEKGFFAGKWDRCVGCDRFLSDCRVFGQLHPGCGSKRCGRAFAEFQD